MDFESPVEPFRQMPNRPVNVADTGNGCLEGVSWNEYYVFNVCLATTCDVEDYAIERTTKQARAGDHSVRFMLKPTPLDKWPLGEATHRAELSPTSTSPIRRYPTEGEERWYGMSVFFPNDFVFAPDSLENDLRFIIAQWQHGSEGSPIFAFEIYGDKIAVATAKKSGVSTNTSWVPPQFIAHIEKGQWIDLVVQIKWAKEDGMVKVWVDGQEKYQHLAMQTIYDDLSRGGGFKVGLYYWRWKYKASVEASYNAGISKREIFIDEVREYLGTDGFSAVMPANRY
jgi:hypothetical protein